MTCKDCIHSEICKYRNRPLPLSDCTYDESNNVEKIGCPFADKSRFIELPFAPGQIVYWIVCDCGNCEYRAVVDCCARNEHPCKYIVEEIEYRLNFFFLNAECFATKEEAEKVLKERENNE